MGDKSTDVLVSSFGTPMHLPYREMSPGSSKDLEASKMIAFSYFSSRHSILMRQTSIEEFGRELFLSTPAGIHLQRTC